MSYSIFMIFATNCCFGVNHFSLEGLSMQDLPFSALVRFQVNLDEIVADKMSQMLLRVTYGVNTPENRQEYLLSKSVRA